MQWCHTFIFILIIALQAINSSCQLQSRQLLQKLKEIKETNAENAALFRRQLSEQSAAIQKFQNLKDSLEQVPEQNSKLSETLQKLQEKRLNAEHTFSKHTYAVRLLLQEIKESQDRNKRTLEEQLSKHLDEFRKLNEIIARSPSQNQITATQLGKLLSRAIKNGDEHKIFQLLLHVSVEHEDENKNRPVHLSVVHLRPQVLVMLLEFGANVDSVGQYKRTALHWAGRNNCLECGNILLAKGANIHLKDIFQNTALHHPAIIGFTPFIEMLLENGVDVNAVQQDNETAVYLACEERNLMTVKIRCRQTNSG